MLHGNLASGEVPKWSKGSDCKSDGTAFTGSNPVFTIVLFQNDKLKGIIKCQTMIMRMHLWDV